MVTDEGSVPQIAQYGPYYIHLNVLLLPKESNFYISFIIALDNILKLTHARLFCLVDNQLVTSLDGFLLAKYGNDRHFEKVKSTKIS